LGGDESAPDPHDLFDSSLAACTAITLTMYAKRKGMPLEAINIELERDNSKEKNGEYGLALKIEFVGDLTDEQKQQLMVIAGKCPIYKLMSQTTISISHSQV
jgi:putative redox protein